MKVGTLKRATVLGKKPAPRNSDGTKAAPSSRIPANASKIVTVAA